MKRTQDFPLARLLMVVAGAAVGIGLLFSPEGGALASAAPAEEEGDRAQAPNVILIMADDLGHGDLGSYGQERIQTPSLDRLAAEGRQFSQFYAGAPVCGPSRATLMTGLHTGHVSVRGNPRQAVGWDIANGDPPLPDDTVTFAKLFKQADYDTAIIGKWGFGTPGMDGDPKAMGFDYFFGYDNHRDAHHYYPDHLWRDETKVPLDGETYSHDLFTEDALKYVREHQDDPFMLFLSYTIPHSRIEVPDLGPYENEDWPDVEKRFAAMITRMDRDIGRLMDLLSELELDENTLVIFTSDNGAYFGSGHRVLFFDSNGELQGSKRAVYDGGIRVPLLARWPGKIEAGSKSDHIAAFWDFVPTCAELLNEDPPQDIDGISMLPALLGDSDRQEEHDFLYWEFGEQGGKQAVRMGKWKGVRLNVSTEENPPLELYDLEADVSESNDIADDHPEIVEEIERIMAREHEPAPMFPLTPEERQKAQE